MEVKQPFYIPFEHPIAIEKYDDVQCNLCGASDYSLIGTELNFEIRHAA